MAAIYTVNFHLWNEKPLSNKRFTLYCSPPTNKPPLNKHLVGGERLLEYLKYIVTT